MTRTWQRGLYAITDADLMVGEDFTARIDEAITGGAVLIQYRDKSATGTERGERARMALACCRNHGVPLLINDDLELAFAIGADGVHLGRNDVPPDTARRRLGPRAIIGVSCYNQLPRALAAAESGADYVAFGRFFPSRTKPHAEQAEVDLLCRAKRNLKVPVAAIGGITADNGAALLEAGADLLAVIRGVFGEPDVAAAAHSLAALFADEAGSRRLKASSL